MHTFKGKKPFVITDFDLGHPVVSLLRTTLMRPKRKKRRKISKRPKLEEPMQQIPNLDYQLSCFQMKEITKASLKTITEDSELLFMDRWIFRKWLEKGFQLENQKKYLLEFDQNISKALTM